MDRMNYYWQINLFTQIYGMHNSNKALFANNVAKLFLASKYSIKKLCITIIPSRKN